MALVPPPNAAGVPTPPNPANPPSLADIFHAKCYVDNLSRTIGNPAYPNQATPIEIGEAEVYKLGTIVRHQPAGAAAPPWLANLTNTVNQQILADVALLRQDLNLLTVTLPIMLSNSKAGNTESLFDPRNPGWTLLTAPNPRTRDELMDFNAAQCAASANNLGLPPIPADTALLAQRRRIASRIGVTIS